MLTAADRALLGRLLVNEADMAFRRRALTLLDYLELADGQRILDCGCGTGFHLMVLEALRDVGLAGVDLDAGRIEAARRLGLRAELAVSPAESLPYADETFDRVLMSEVLEHLRDDRAALREAHRVLRPGGVLAISVPHARFPFWWDPINPVWMRLGGGPIRRGPVAGMWSNHERLYAPEELATRVTGAGFAIEALEEATHYCLPFSHFLVYGIGKPLVEHGLLPRRLHAVADRCSGRENSGRLLHPFNLLRALFRLVDRLNERDVPPRRPTFVNVLVKARKPDGRDPVAGSRRRAGGAVPSPTGT